MGPTALSAMHLSLLDGIAVYKRIVFLVSSRGSGRSCRYATHARVLNAHIRPMRIVPGRSCSVLPRLAINIGVSALRGRNTCAPRHNRCRNRLMALWVKNFRRPAGFYRQDSSVDDARRAVPCVDTGIGELRRQCRRQARKGHCKIFLERWSTILSELAVWIV